MDLGFEPRQTDIMDTGFLVSHVQNPGAMTTGLAHDVVEVALGTSTMSVKEFNTQPQYSPL